jgi:hypothetical protein
MTMDENALLVEIIVGAVATGYVVYGRKQQRPLPLICGLAMFVVPLVIPVWWALAVCVALAAAPWLVR